MEKYEPTELNTLLERFYADKQGEDYKPERLKAMALLLDRHLKNKGYSLSIIWDRKFISSKQVLDEKAKQILF